MAESFFTTNFMGTEVGNTDPKLFTNTGTTQSAQGQLSSQYTAALTGALTSDAVADYFAYLHFVATGDADAAQAVKDAILDGAFNLSDLFGAAQSKIGPVSGINVADPTPTLHLTGDLAGINFDLTSILTGLDTESWVYVDTINSGKKVSTVTTYHTREFYTGIEVPDHPDWGNPPQNLPPEASEWSVSATETTSTYDGDHHITNQPDLVNDWTLEVDLLDPTHVSDPEGNDLTVGNIQFYDVNHVAIAQPSYVTVDAVSGTITIDQNHPDLNSLKDGELLNLRVEYTISDGTNADVPNAVNIAIEGTPDQYHGSGTGSSTPVVYTGAQMNVTANSGTASIDPNSLPADGFDFSFAGSITVTASGLVAGENPNEKITVADGNANDWANDAFVLTSAHATETQILDQAGAFDDMKVDFNVSKNASVDSDDSVTVMLNYTYDYWYYA